MQRYLLPLLMSMVVLSPIAIDIFLSSIPEMARALHATSSQVQSTLSLFFLAMGFGQILVGPLVDKYGRRPISLYGLLLYIASSAMAAMVSDISYMQIARVLQGFASCAISVVIFSVVRDSFSYARTGKIYSYLNGAISVIPALAPTFGSVLAAYFGWRSTFVFMFCYASVILLMVYLWLPETMRKGKVTMETELYKWRRYQPVLRNPRFIFYAFCCMAAMASILSYVSYAPLWLIEHLQISALTFSLLFGLNACTSIICCFVTPMLITRKGNKAVVTLALGFMFLGAVLLLISYWTVPTSGAVAALGFMLPVMSLSIGFSMLLGPATSIALAEFSARAGTASALLGFIQMAGAALIVALIQQSNLVAPIAVAVVILALVLPLITIISIPKLANWHREVYPLD